MEGPTPAQIWRVGARLFAVMPVGGVRLPLLLSTSSQGVSPFLPLRFRPSALGLPSSKAPAPQGQPERGSQLPQAITRVAGL